VLLVPSLLRALASEAERFIQRAVTEPFDGFDANLLIGSVLRVCLPLILVTASATFLVRWGVGGGAISTGVLAPRLDRVAPRDGLGRLLSGERWFAAARLLVGAFVVVAIGLAVLRPNAAGLADTAGSFEDAVSGAAAVAERIALIVACAFAVIAALDFAVARAAILGRLRMTRAEVKRERRDAEGPPQVREARRRAREAMALGADLAVVAESTVVLSDGAQSAAAVAYDAERDHAPRVTLLAHGDAAAAVIRAARTRGVPVSSEPAAVRALVDAGSGENSPIPTWLYPELARILGGLSRPTH
jgi:flagellar biosynthesis protein FlhB